VIPERLLDQKLIPHNAQIFLLRPRHGALEKYRRSVREIPGRFDRIIGAGVATLICQDDNPGGTAQVPI